MAEPINITVGGETVTTYSQYGTTFFTADKVEEKPETVEEVVEPKLPEQVTEIIAQQTLPIEAWSTNDLRTIAQTMRWHGWHNMKRTTLVRRVTEIL